MIGDPTEYLPIINFIIVGYSPEIAKLIDVDISGLTDRLFITYIFKFIEKHFHIDANMSVNDFFTPKKCIHRKMNFIIELINSIRKYLQHDISVYPPVSLYNNKEYNPSNSYLHVLNMSNINSEIDNILKIDKIRKPMKKIDTVISSSSSSSSYSSDNDNYLTNSFESSPKSSKSNLLLSLSNSENENDIENSSKPIEYHKSKSKANQSGINNTHISFEDKSSNSFNNSSLLPSNPNISIESDNKNVNVTIIPNSTKRNSFEENSSISKQLQQILEEMTKMNTRLDRLEERMSKIESKT